MPLSNNAYNLATGNKWILTIPFKSIDQKFSANNVALNLTNFSIPELTIESADISQYGRTFNVPTGTRNEDKTISFNYMLSSNWHQYDILYKWFNLVSNQDTSGYEVTPSEFLLDLSVYVLSEYKNPIFRIDYIGAWISALDAVDFNYQSAEENIVHGFRINYAFYKFEGLG